MGPFTVSADVEYCIVANGVPLRPQVARMTYLYNEPLCVRLVFQQPFGGEPAVWLVSRDLLAEGLNGTAGRGDVKIQPAVAHGPFGIRSILSVELNSRHGEAVLELLAEPVAVFLQRTCEVVAVGAEESVLFAGFEDELAALLNANISIHETDCKLKRCPFH